MAYLNDASEYVYADDVFKGCVVGINLEDPYAESIAKNVLLFPGLPFLERYTSCFCERGDLLSQWRAYACAGAGYAIRFDWAHLNSKCIATGSAMLGQISYQKKEQENLIRELVSRHFKAPEERNPENLAAVLPPDTLDADESPDAFGDPSEELTDPVPDVYEHLMISQHVGALKDSVVVKAFLKADAFAEERV